MLIACLIGACVAAGCEREPDTLPPSRAPALTDHDAALVAQARAYLRDHHPQWADVGELVPEVTEHEDHWQVTWRLPPDMLGGTPVVHVDKRSGEVREAYHTQ